MDGALVTALGVFASAAVTGAFAVYGSRVAGRVQREGNAVTGFNHLTNELQEERQELKTELAALRLELATERAESARLRLLVLSLGGTP